MNKLFQPLTSKMQFFSREIEALQCIECGNIIDIKEAKKLLKKSIDYCVICESNDKNIQF